MTYDPSPALIGTRAPRIGIWALRTWPKNPISIHIRLTRRGSRASTASPRC